MKPALLSICQQSRRWVDTTIEALAHMESRKAHGEITIRIKEGRIALVTRQETFKHADEMQASCGEPGPEAPANQGTPSTAV